MALICSVWHVEGARLAKKQKMLWDTKCIASCAWVSPIIILHKYNCTSVLLICLRGNVTLNVWERILLLWSALLWTLFWRNARFWCWEGSIWSNVGMMWRKTDERIGVLKKKRLRGKKKALPVLRTKPCSSSYIMGYQEKAWGKVSNPYRQWVDSWWG